MGEGKRKKKKRRRRRKKKKSIERETYGTRLNLSWKRRNTSHELTRRQMPSFEGVGRKGLWCIGKRIVDRHVRRRYFMDYLIGTGARLQRGCWMDVGAKVYRVLAASSWSVSRDLRWIGWERLGIGFGIVRGSGCLSWICSCFIFYWCENRGIWRGLIDAKD